MNRNDTRFQSHAASTSSCIDKFGNDDTALGSFLAPNSTSNTETILEGYFKTISSLSLLTVVVLFVVERLNQCLD